MTEEMRTPKYELHACNHGAGDLELAVWQVPCEATPHVKEPIRVAGLKGRNLSFVENRVLKALKKAGIDVGPKPKEKQSFPLGEDLALNLGLLFVALGCILTFIRMYRKEKAGK